MTHKEAIECLEFYLQSTPSPLQYKKDEIIKLLRQDMWHEYNKEKPKKEGFYLVKTIQKHGGFNQTNYVISHFTIKKDLQLFDVIDEDVVIWKEIIDYEREVNL